MKLCKQKKKKKIEACQWFRISVPTLFYCIVMSYHKSRVIPHDATIIVQVVFTGSVLRSLREVLEKIYSHIRYVHLRWARSSISILGKTESSGCVNVVGVRVVGFNLKPFSHQLLSVLGKISSSLKIPLIGLYGNVWNHDFLNLVIIFLYHY